MTGMFNPVWTTVFFPYWLYLLLLQRQEGAVSYVVEPPTIRLDVGPPAADPSTVVAVSFSYLPSFVACPTWSESQPDRTGHVVPTKPHARVPN
jgi:hypothetical protein